LLTKQTSTNFYSWNLFNQSKNFRFKDLNSSNFSFLTSEKKFKTAFKEKKLESWQRYCI
jgi:hypothetical protein